MKPRPRSPRAPLSVRVVFEPGRLAARSLADAYEYIVASAPAHLARRTWAWMPASPAPDAPAGDAGEGVQL